MVHLAGNAEGMAEIQGTEKEYIDAPNFGDLLQLVHGLDILNLQDDETLLVCLAQILAAWHQSIPCVGIAAIECTPAKGMESRLPDHLLGLFGTHDVRHHDAGGVDLQGANHIAVTAAADADYRVHIVHLGRSDLLLDFPHRIGNMFHAEPDAIEPAQGGNLGGARVRHVQLDTTGYPAARSLASTLLCRILIVSKFPCTRSYSSQKKN